jgi:hypothetical protein
LRRACRYRIAGEYRKLIFGFKIGGDEYIGFVRFNNVKTRPLHGYFEKWFITLRFRLFVADLRDLERTPLGDSQMRTRHDIITRMYRSHSFLKP